MARKLQEFVRGLPSHYPGREDGGPDRSGVPATRATDPSNVRPTDCPAGLDARRGLSGREQWPRSPDQRGALRGSRLLQAALPSTGPLAGHPGPAAMGSVHRASAADRSGPVLDSPAVPRRPVPLALPLHPSQHRGDGLACVLPGTHPRPGANRDYRRPADPDPGLQPVGRGAMGLDLWLARRLATRQHSTAARAAALSRGWSGVSSLAS